MTIQHWLFIIGIGAGALNGIILILINRAFRRSDETDAGINRLTNAINTVVTKMEIIERDVKDYRQGLRDMDDIKYEAKRAMDTAKRAHERIDSYTDEIKTFRDVLTLQEKTLLKLSIVTESLQERLGELVVKGKA